MHRTVVILALAAAGITTPLAAQGHGHKQVRTWVDSRGRECRETTQYKGNGDSKYEVKCRSAKHHDGRKHDDRDDDDDDDRGYSDNRSCFDQQCGVVTGRGYPARRRGDRGGPPWMDSTRDQRADAVRVHRDGRAVKVVGG